MKRYTSLVGTGALVVGVLSMAACGQSNSGSSAAGAQGATATSIKGNGQKMVMFLPSTSNSYIGADAQAAKAEAAKLGYQLQVFENKFDQTEEDQQVQQYIATGEKPAAVLWWPSNSQAGINSVRQLSAVAPVFQFNQGILPASKQYVKLYAGVDDNGIGSTAGTMALKMRSDAKAAGLKEHSPGGNMLEFSFTEGYQAGLDRHNSFVKASSSAPFNILRNEPCGFDAQAGYKCATSIIPKYKSQGIDYIYAHNNNMAVGIVQALKENGLTPGKDVFIVSGDLSGDKTPMKNGLVYSAVVQSPIIEGQLIVDSAAQYAATKKVKDGTCNVAPDAVKPEIQVTPPCATTFMPNPPVTKTDLNTFKIWGLSIDQLVR